MLLSLTPVDVQDLIFLKRATETHTLTLYAHARYVTVLLVFLFSLSFFHSVVNRTGVRNGTLSDFAHRKFQNRTRRQGRQRQDLLLPSPCHIAAPPTEPLVSCSCQHTAHRRLMMLAKTGSLMRRWSQWAGAIPLASDTKAEEHMEVALTLSTFCVAAKASLLPLALLSS